MAASMRRIVLQQLNGCLLLGHLRQSMLKVGSRTIGSSPSKTQHTDSALAQVEEPEGNPYTRPSLSQVDQVLQHDDYFGVKQLVTLQDLFKARVHLGHNSGLRHESMLPYIFGERQGTDIIDLEHTVPLLQHALDVCSHVVYRGGMVLFLSRHQQTLPWVERMAREVGEYSHCRPWKRGIFTNAEAVFGTLPIYPELCVFLHSQDTVFELHHGLVEAAKLLIPSVSVLDTNCDGGLVTYPVPGNDDSPASIHLYLRLFREAVLRAKARRKEDGLE